MKPMSKGKVASDGFYIIYEANALLCLSSIVIKGIGVSRDMAIASFSRLQKEYTESDGWTLRLGWLPQDHEMEEDGNILRDMVDLTQDALTGTP